MADNWSNINTDDYDIYNQQGEITSLPGSPSIDTSGHLIAPPPYATQYFPMPSNASVMDPDPNNTGPTTDFFTAFPITIDMNGDIYYYGENTGVNIRGPQGMSNVRFSDLTPAEREQLRGPAGANGVNGTNGRDGVDGTNGMSAYELWLQENGYLPEEHPIDEFFQYLADIENELIAEDTGIGSIIINNKATHNTAGGQSAFASGYGTSAAGAYSSAFGLNTTAGNANQVVFGKYNENKNTSIFEIGYGDALEHRNIFEVDTNGNLVVTGTITDGGNNVLNNKVDKVAGKTLSSNDFTNTYKATLDNYHVDSVVDGSTNNPVSNAAVKLALDNLIYLSGRPQQASTSTNADYSIGLIFDGTTSTVDKLVFNNSLTWNPNKNILKNTTLVNSNSYSNIIAFGSGTLTAGANKQILLGEYNDSNATDYLQIGNGVEGTPSNLFTISKSGDVVAAGDITDGDGNVLSEKQDILEYDEEPTEDSSNMLTSGAIYDYLLSHGMDPDEGIVIPELNTIMGYITSLQSRVTALETAVAALGNPRELPDDTYPANIYTYGVDNNQFYIQKIRPVDPEPEDDDEEEEDE